MDILDDEKLQYPPADLHFTVALGLHFKRVFEALRLYEGASEALARGSIMEVGDSERRCMF